MRMRFIKQLFLPLVLLPMLSWADAESTQALQAQLKNFKSMQADFIQVTRATDGRVLQQSSGSMALQRPGNFRWLLIEPSRQLIIASNNQLQVYDEDLAQVTMQTIAKNYNSPAFLLSDSNDNLIKKFAIRELKEQEKDKKVFLLQPKQKDDLYTSLQLTFATNALQKIVMVDGLGQVTTINFKHSRVNIKLPEQLFQMNIPPGIDIIKQG